MRCRRLERNLFREWYETAIRSSMFVWAVLRKDRTKDTDLVTSPIVIHKELVSSHDVLAKVPSGAKISI